MMCERHWRCPVCKIVAITTTDHSDPARWFVSCGCLGRRGLAYVYQPASLPAMDSPQYTAMKEFFPALRFVWTQ